MNFLFDVVASVIIGGVVMLLLLGFNSTVMEGTALQTMNSLVQYNLTSVTDVVEYDMRKIGYRVGSGYDSSIVYADSVNILMRGDVDNNGTVDRIAYTFDPAGKSGQANTATRILYRRANDGALLPINLGITRFRLTYYDRNNTLIAENPVNSPSRIKAIRLAINVESTSLYDKQAAGTSWERFFTPVNLK